MDTHAGWFVLVIGFILFLFVGIISISYFSMLSDTDSKQTTPSPSLHTSPPAPVTVTLSPYQVALQQEPSVVYVPQQLSLSPSPQAPQFTQNTCFNMNTVTANKLVGLILKNNLQSKYAPLILTYSAIVCVYQDIQNRKCDRIDSFLNQIIIFGGSPHSASGMTQLSYFTQVPNKPSVTRSFLVAAMDVISNYMAQLINESVLSEQDRSALKGFNYEFCRNYLDSINIACPI